MRPDAFYAVTGHDCGASEKAVNAAREVLMLDAFASALNYCDRTNSGFDSATLLAHMARIIDREMKTDTKTALPCEHCSHVCPTDGICATCGSDPMLLGDRLCAACDATERAAMSKLADEYNADDFARDYPHGEPV